MLYVIRVFIWILVALVLDVIDKKFLKQRGKKIWLVLIFTVIITLTLVPEGHNQFINDVLIIL